MKKATRGAIGCLGLIILFALYVIAYAPVLGHGTVTTVLLWTMLIVFVLTGAAWIRLVRGGFHKHHD